MAVSSVSEAIRAIDFNTGDRFSQLLAEAEYQFQVLINGNPISDLRMCVAEGKPESIEFVPVMGGAGRGLGFLIGGLALLIIAPYFVVGASSVGAAGYGAAFSAVFTGGGTLASSLVATLGISLVLGGLGQLILGDQNVEAEDQKEPGFHFQGLQNTTKEGLPVPVLFGRHFLIGSAVVSAGVKTVVLDD